MLTLSTDITELSVTPFVNVTPRTAETGGITTIVVANKAGKKIPMMKVVEKCKILYINYINYMA